MLSGDQHIGAWCGTASTTFTDGPVQFTAPAAGTAGSAGSNRPPRCRTPAGRTRATGPTASATSSAFSRSPTRRSPSPRSAPPEGLNGVGDRNSRARATASSGSTRQPRLSDRVLAMADRPHRSLAPPVPRVALQPRLRRRLTTARRSGRRLLGGRPRCSRRRRPPVKRSRRPGARPPPRGRARGGARHCAPLQCRPRRRSPARPRGTAPASGRAG